jgi:hypothetical protein
MSVNMVEMMLWTLVFTVGGGVLVWALVTGITRLIEGPRTRRPDPPLVWPKPKPREVDVEQPKPRVCAVDGSPYRKAAPAAGRCQHCGSGLLLLDREAYLCLKAGMEARIGEERRGRQAAELMVQQQAELIIDMKLMLIEKNREKRERQRVADRRTRTTTAPR